MADEAHETAGAADNTAQSEAQDQALLDPKVPEEQQNAASETPDQPEDGGKPLLSPEGETPEDKKDVPAGAPETYGEFTLPEGFELSGDVLEEAKTLFRGLDLSQERAQKLVDYYTKRMLDEKEKGLSDLAARRKSWREEVRQRPNFAQERALAIKGLRAVVTDPDEKELFQDSWMSDHPALWKVFVKIGRLVGEDTPPRGAGNPPGEENINMLRFPNA